MLALATSIKIRAKIDEKMHVLGDIDFGSIFERFWEGFGRPKSTIFAFFSIFFRCKILGATWKDKKSKKKANKRPRVIFLVDFCGLCDPGGKDYRMGGSLPKPEFQALP